MANETEVERLVVRLVGDSSQYTAMLDDVAQESIQSLKALEESINEVAAQGKLLEANSGAMEALDLATQHAVTALAEYTDMVEKGTITEEEFNEASIAIESSVRRMAATIADAKAAQDEENQALDDAANLHRSLLTPQELYEQGLARVQDHLLNGRISQEDYNRAIEKLTMVLPETIEAQKRASEALAAHNQLVREGMTIMERNKSAVEKYDDAMIRLSSHLVAGTITEKAYNAEVERLQQTLPDVIAKNQERIAQEKFQIELEKLHLKTLSDLRKEDEAMIAADIKAAQAKAVASMTPATAAANPLMAQLKSMAGPALAGIGIQQTISAVRNDMEEIDRLATQAQRIGIDIRDKQLLDFAAKQSSVSIDQLDRGLKKYNMTVLNAASGNEKASAGFKAMGLNASEITNLPLPEQMKAIADGLENITDVRKRQQIAVQLFGKDGASLVSLLGQGGDELEKLFKKREELGPLLSKEDAAAVKDANDAMERAAMSLDLAFKKSVAELAPLVEALADFSTSDMGKGIRGADTNSGIQYRVGGSGMLNNIDVIETMRNMWNDFQEAQAHGAKLRGEDWGTIFASSANMAMSKSLKQFGLGDWFDETSAQADKYGEIFGKTYGESMLKGLSWQETWDELWKKLSEPPPVETTNEFQMEGYDELIAAQEKGREATEKAIEALEKQRDTLGMTSDQVAIYEARLNGATAEQIGYIKQMQIQIQQEKIVQDSIKKTADEAKKKVEDEKRARDAIDKSIEALQRQVDTYGMTAAQISVYDLKQKGATEADLARAQALANERDELEKTAKAQKEHAKLLEEGKKITEKLLTPMEEYKKEVAELEKLFMADAISLETFDKALTEMEKELAEAEFDLVIDAKVEGLEAVRANTKEFFDLQRQSANINEANKAYGKKMRELRGEGGDPFAAPAAPVPKALIELIPKDGTNPGQDAVTVLKLIQAGIDALVAKEVVEVQETSLSSS